MRLLILLRGVPGSGKSTFVQKAGLTAYTLSTDDLRLLYTSPKLMTNGNLTIDQKVSKKVFSTLKTLTEERMKSGDLTVIDATHCTDSSFSWYKDLCNIYKYRAICIDFEVDRAELLKRDVYRGFKSVGVSVIDRMLKNKEESHVPGWIKTYTDKEFMEHQSEIIGIKYTDLDEYKNVYIIGDIHGCNTALQKLLNNTFCDDCFYIFTGDYLDRGIENAEVFHFLYENCERKNIVMLEGNHERHLRDCVHGFNIVSEEFANSTLPQLISNGVTKQDIRGFYRKLAQVFAFTYHGNKYFCNHAGIPYTANFEGAIAKISTEHFIKGVGSYEALPEVMEQWNTNSPHIIQVCGHRNLQKYNIINDKYFVLEGQVEFGGYLRAVRLYDNMTEEIAIKNDIVSEEFRKKEIERNVSTNRETSVSDAIKLLRESKLIHENKFGNISSFNFTKQAFFSNAFNGITCKARGLFINTTRNVVVARGYDKFFNLNQNETSVDKLEFPVRSYEKYNGFLGLLGYDEETDELVYTSKSQIAGEGEARKYANMFKETLNKCITEVNLHKIKQILKEQNLSLAFECINKLDPHIVEYSSDEVVLLDAFYRTIKTENIPYDDFVQTFGSFVKVKELKAIINDLNELQAHIDTMDKLINHEGVVIEGKNGYMIKLKNHFYNFWKFMRAAVDSYNNGHTWRKLSNATVDDDEVYTKFQNWYEQYGIPGTDIITNRKLYFKYIGAEQ